MAGTKQKRQGDAWMLQVQIDGKRFNKTVHCKSEAGADRELAKFYSACESGAVNTGNIQFGDLCDLYLKSHCEGKLKRSTVQLERSAIESRLKPQFKMRASKIKRRDVQDWVDDMSRELSPKTIRNYCSVMSSIMRWAVEKEYIVSTPCQFIEYPKMDRKESAHYEIDDICRLICVINKAELKYRTAILIMMMNGLRISEVTGLNWSDIDLDSGQFKIKRERLYRAKLGAYEDDPKSKKSKRYGTFTDDILQLLKKWSAQQKEDRLRIGSRWIASDAVFTDWDGRPTRPNQIYNYWKKFCRDNDLRYIPPHGLRHTYASMLLYMDMDLKEIQEGLGHSQASTTLNIYAHLIEDRRKKSRETTDKVQTLIQSMKTREG